MALRQPIFPGSHGKPRVDQLRVLSGLIFIIRNGRRWRGGPKTETINMSRHAPWVGACLLKIA